MFAAGEDFDLNFIMTSNAPEEFYTPEGYGRMVAGYQNSLSNFIGPTKVMICGNTLQVNDRRAAVEAYH